MLMRFCVNGCYINVPDGIKKIVIDDSCKRSKGTQSNTETETIKIAKTLEITRNQDFKVNCVPFRPLYDLSVLKGIVMDHFL